MQARAAPVVDLGLAEACEKKDAPEHVGLTAAHGVGDGICTTNGPEWT